MPLILGPALDPTTLERTGDPATLDPGDLRRHMVCVGMTGSGKTGLCVGVIESLAVAGIPVLAIDPKGDLANLALALDPRKPAEYAPWVDPAEATREGIDVPTLAARTAASIARALEADGVGPETLVSYKESVEVVVHTPGSEAGVPIDVLTALTHAPSALVDDPEGLRDYVTGAVTALLGLIGLEVDPLTDPRAILLARIFGEAFAAGEALPFDVLLPRIVDPPFDTLGYFAVEDVLTRQARTALAVALNNVAASPAFQAWLTGVPLDVASWMRRTEDGKTPVRILSLAHLDDRQRQFFVTMLLHAVVAWSRRLPGTGSLRAVLYFDEVAGYLPPHPKDPPTKAPVMTLMKQARAVGLGVILCTQNPVDVDYKALSNAGTWFVGRLQTKQDRARLIDGLVAATGGLDTGAIDELLGRLPKRAFVWHTAEQPSARVLRTRHVFSYLRGPLTRREIAQLGQTWERLSAPSDGLLAEPPPLPPEVPVRWLSADGAKALGLSAAAVWSPTLYARYRVTLASHDAAEERVVHRWLRPGAESAEAVALEDAWLGKREPTPDGRYQVVGSDFWASYRRLAWEDEIRATEVLETPEGRVVRPDRNDVEVLGWAVVWVPQEGTRAG